MAMSFEAVLDEERKEILALLEGTPLPKLQRGSASSEGARRASSPFTRQPHSPMFGSMLDLDDDEEEDEPPRKISLNGNNGTGLPVSPRQTPSIRSMLDITTPPPQPPVRSMLEVGINNGYSTSYIGATHKKRPSSTSSSRSAASSPTEEKSNNKVLMANSGIPHRSLSDAASHPASFRPRTSSTSGMVESAYQFSGYLPSNPGGPVAPKRNSLAGKKTSAMAEVMKGGTISLFGDRDRDSARHHSIATTGINTAKSKSPANRSNLRSNSPHMSTDGTRIILKDGRAIDMNKAYRRLSDANLAISGGGLGKKQRSRTNSSDVAYANGHRLEKDYTNVGEGAIVDSSDDEASISDDDQQRGRKHEQRQEGNLAAGLLIVVDRAKGRKQAQSQMAAAEEERDLVAGQQVQIPKIRSLLDPEITVTTPTGDRFLRFSKPVVHPNTSFDEGTSGLNTPVDSDAEEDVVDIKRAQKLAVNMTPVISTPATSRCVRTIFRGDFAKMQQEAEDHSRRVRKYLVATDLSDEAAHALEWTVGTVLRDGDTLLAIYCVDEEVGIANVDSGDDSRTREQIAAIEASTKASSSTPILSPVHAPSPLGQGFRLDSHSASASPMGREKGKAEQERFRAVQDITDRVSRLLRKTKLQVKVVIEVIHCKSPKHLITEVIDYISPTMVILGSRGQSQLKGVILGSFSNYLVTKSSVPVMVARKRLRKHTKYKRPSIRLANNLSNPVVNSLSLAKVDEIEQRIL